MAFGKSASILEKMPNHSLLQLCFAVLLLLKLGGILVPNGYHRNLLMIQWLSQAMTAANSAFAIIASGNSIVETSDKFGRSCNCGRSAVLKRNCVYRDMSALMGQNLDSIAISTRIREYPEGSIERSTLAHFAGDYFYERGDLNLATQLWQDFLPEEVQVFRTHQAIANQDYHTAESLLSAIQKDRMTGSAGDYLSSALVAMARWSFDQRNLELAEAYWRRAIKQRPERPSYYVGLARALSGQNRWLEAAEVLEKPIELQPEQAQFHIFLGQALLHGEQFEAAFQAAQTALALEPDNIDAHNLLHAVSERLDMSSDG